MREYLLTCFVAACTTYLLVGVAGRLARRWGAVPEVRDRDVHATPVPRLGGMAMMVGVVVAMAVASGLPVMRQVFDNADDVRALLLAALLICLVGVADDIWDLDALTKLAGQMLAAGVLVVSGVQLYWVPLPGGPFVLDPLMGALLTVLLVMTTINAVNFVDGLDGLAAGVVGIGATAFFSYSYLLSVGNGLSRMTTPTMVSVILAGVCLGFLPHNVYPAKIFMGDSGAMLIGLLLAASAISLSGQVDSQALPAGTSVLPALLPLILPVAVVLIPMVDLLAAVVRRTRAGRSPFSPDKQHLHHRLLDIGHTQRRAVALMWLWAGLIAFGVVVVALVGGTLTWAVYLALLAAAAVLTLRAAPAPAA